MKDKLARDLDSVEGPHSGNISSALSCHPTLGFTPVSAVNLAPASASATTNELYKKFMKAYLESNQEYRQPPVKLEQSFKAKVPVVYYNKLHMDCYHFCQ